MKHTILATLLLIAACSPQKDSTRKFSFNGIEIESSVINDIEDELGKEFEPLKETVWLKDSTVAEDSVLAGVQIPRVKDETARRIARKNLSKLMPSGYYIYLKNLDFGENFTQSYYDIAIIPCKDQFELVRFAYTSGVNYNVTNEDVINKLRKWNTESPFTIVVADEDRIEADFIELPKDLNAFAKDIYEFCPDVIDQGAGSEEELIKFFQSEKSFWLWFD